MAKQSKVETANTTATASEVATAETISVKAEVLEKGAVNLYEAFHEKLRSAYMQKDNANLKIAGALTVITEKGLYKVRGYKNTLEYLDAEFGRKMSKATLSDTLGVFKAFGSTETGELLDEWRAYGFSQLKLIKRIQEVAPDKMEEIHPNMTARALQAIINNAKALSDKSAEATEATEATEETEATQASSTGTVTKEETSGEVEPYVEWSYTIDEFMELDPSALHTIILEHFKKGCKVILNYK